MSRELNRKKTHPKSKNRKLLVGIRKVNTTHFAEFELAMSVSQCVCVLFGKIASICPDKQETTNFIKINNRFAAKHLFTSNATKCRKICLVYVFRCCVFAVVIVTKFECIWPVCNGKTVSVWMNVFHRNERFCLFKRSHLVRINNMQVVVVVIVIVIAVVIAFLFDTILLSFFFLSQWSVKMARNGISSNWIESNVSVAIMMFMVTTLHFIMCNDHYFITFILLLYLYVTFTIDHFSLSFFHSFFFLCFILVLINADMLLARVCLCFV